MSTLSAATWNGEGYVYKGLARHDEALTCIARALELEPENGDYWDSSRMCSRSKVSGAKI